MRFGPLLIALAFVGCTYRGGVGRATYAPGSTQDDVAHRLAPGDRVLFRDDRLMIIDGPQGGRELRFDDRGRLGTDMPAGAGAGGRGGGGPR